MFGLRRRIKLLAFVIAVLAAIELSGVYIHLLEKDFATTFEYPLDDVDLLTYVQQLRDKRVPSVAPINVYNFTFTSDCRHKCIDADGSVLEPRLVFIVKSAMEHFGHRNAIRQSWGFERRFSDVTIRTVFVVGEPSPSQPNQHDLQSLLDTENDQFEDIVRANFIDTYFNNTIKTVMGLKWAVEHCPRSRFYMFIDDDYFVSTKNVLRFLRDPVNYPEYLQEADQDLRNLAMELKNSEVHTSNSSMVLDNEKFRKMHKLVNQYAQHTIDNKEHVNKLKQYLAKASPNQIALLAKAPIYGDIELPVNVKLYAGYVFETKPLRHKFSKWHVSLNEYRWDKWPPYVTAGAYILSREALATMYYASMYTKHFR